jgi:hypothetical protein
MSEDYRKSNYCRAEAHYAFQRQRKIVPILSEKHYRPDGWLLFLIGQLLYVDFNKHPFDRAMNMLLKELKLEESPEISVSPVHPKEDAQNVTTVVAETPPKAVVSSPIAQNISEWSATQVQQWLNEHNLTQMARLLAGCDGRSVVYLNKYLKNGPIQQILHLLQEDSLRRINQSISLIELSCFHSLMDRQKKPKESSSSNTNDVQHF